MPALLKVTSDGVAPGPAEDERYLLQSISPEDGLKGASDVSAELHAALNQLRVRASAVRGLLQTFTHGGMLESVQSYSKAYHISLDVVINAGLAPKNARVRMVAEAAAEARAYHEPASEALRSALEKEEDRRVSSIALAHVLVPDGVGRGKNAKNGNAPPGPGVANILKEMELLKVMRQASQTQTVTDVIRKENNA